MAGGRDVQGCPATEDFCSVLRQVHHHPGPHHTGLAPEQRNGTAHHVAADPHHFTSQLGWKCHLAQSSQHLASSKPELLLATIFLLHLVLVLVRQTFVVIQPPGLAADIPGAARVQQETTQRLAPQAADPLPTVAGVEDDVVLLPGHSRPVGHGEEALVLRVLCHKCFSLHLLPAVLTILHHMPKRATCQA